MLLWLILYEVQVCCVVQVVIVLHGSVLCCDGYYCITWKCTVLCWLLLYYVEVYCVVLVVIVLHGSVLCCAGYCITWKCTVLC